MVRSINDIAHVMGIKTIAEFVEDEQIAAQIRSLGVDYAQGYGICLPLSLDDYLASRRELRQSTARIA